MGMYTDLRLDVVLRDDTPENVRDALAILIHYDLDAVPFDDRLTHPFWRDSRASFLGSGHDGQIPEYDFPRLRIRCEVKNYDKVLQKFMDWLAPYVQTATGTYKYEEDDEPSKVELVLVDGAWHFAIRGQYPAVVPRFA